MFRNVAQLVILLALLVSLSGCWVAAVGVGAVVGVGGTVWVEGKLKQDLPASKSKAEAATTKALNALGINITKTISKEILAQIRAEYTDGRSVWIDIHRVSDNSSYIEIRVGASGDREASEKILSKIQSYL